jgi:hypothetical protein
MQPGGPVSLSELREAAAAESRDRAPVGEREARRATLVVLDHLFGPREERAFTVRLWDGSEDAPAHPTAPFELVLRRPGALRRMLLPVTELSIVEA